MGGWTGGGSGARAGQRDGCDRRGIFKKGQSYAKMEREDAQTIEAMLGALFVIVLCDWLDLLLKRLWMHWVKIGLTLINPELHLDPAAVS